VESKAYEGFKLDVMNNLAAGGSSALIDGDKLTPLRVEIPI
jgi:hypothetical protein